MKNMKVLLSATILGVFVTSCSSNKIKHNKVANQCQLSGQVIKTLTNQKGRFLKDENTGRFSVSVHTPGTIDEVSIYLLCNTPSKLPKNDSEIIVSGNVRSSAQRAQVGGHTYYELEVTMIN